MKLPKWMVPSMDWKPQPVEPHWLWQGRKFFWLLSLVGAMAFLGSFLGLAESLGEAAAVAVLGAGLLVGAGGTLALSYEKVAPENTFLVKAAVRVGFMVVGPAIFCVTMIWEPFAPETEGKQIAWAAAVLCGVTVIPFGASLLKLFRDHRQKK